MLGWPYVRIVQGVAPINKETGNGLGNSFEKERKKKYKSLCRTMQLLHLEQLQALRILKCIEHP